MEAIGCLVPELWSEKHRGRGMQLFQKMQCFYVATCLGILSCYVKLTHVVVKKSACKSPKTVGKDSSCESEGLHCVYRQKDNRIQTGYGENTSFGNAYHDVHSNVFPYFADLPVSSSL